MPKLSDREQKLVFWLILIMMVSAVALFSYIEREEMKSIGMRIAALELQMNKLHGALPERNGLLARREYLIEAIEKEGRMYYARNAIDPYVFSITVRKALLANRLEIRKYQTVDAKDTIILEFSLSGSAADLMRFLKTASTNEKYWYIPYISIDAAKGDGSISAVLRIHFETLDSIDG